MLPRLIPALVLASGAVACGGGDGGGGEPPATIASVRQPITYRDVTYTVTSVGTARRVFKLGGQVSARAKGVFVIVRILVATNSHEPVEIPGSVRLVDRTGESYGLHDEGCLLVKPTCISFVSRAYIEAPEQVAAIFDVPPEAVPGSRLQVHEIGRGDEITIRLGL